MSEAPIILSTRERASVLAALRYWQWQRLGAGHLDPDEFRVAAILDIADNGAAFAMLSEEEVDHLCLRLNDTGTDA